MFNSKVEEGEETWNMDSLYYHHIPTGKKAIGDSLYSGMPEKCTIPRNVGHSRLTKKLINLAKACEERHHGHTKEFHVLKYRFRHDMEKNLQMS